MAGFTKLFSSILDSTIWQEPNETRLLWITMLAMSDANGEIQSSIPGLARRAAITLDQCEVGLETLLSPDNYSRTKDHDGRRIAAVNGGWQLLNHGRYRALLSYEERKEYNRIKQAERRAKLNCVNYMSNNVKESKQCKHITDNRLQITDTEASIKNKTKTKTVAFHAPSLSEVEEYGKTLSPKFTRAASFIDFYESNGWKVGKNPMKSWQAAVRTWNSKEQGSQPAKAHRKNEYPQETLQLPD